MTYYIINSEGVIQRTTNNLEFAEQSLSSDNYIVELDYEFLESLHHIGRTIVDNSLLPLTNEETLLKRREERTIEFSNTLDLMQPLWFSDLTLEQQEGLAAWRQAWLEYPSTGIKPERPEGIF